MSQFITRRKFLKSISLLGLSAVPHPPLFPKEQKTSVRWQRDEFMPPPLPLPHGEQFTSRHYRFGRVTTWRAGVHEDPDPESPEVGERRFDDIVNILEEVEGVGHYTHNPYWFRLIDGYIYTSWVQPVAYRFNRPISKINPPGFLAWITVPYTDVRARPKEELPRRYRLYYDSIFRVIEAQTDETGQVWYGLRDGLTWSGVNWAKAEHLRLIPPRELEPLSPHVEDKHILIELSRQWLTCFEGEEAVFETRLSSGMPGLVTPQGTHHVLQKTPTTRMIGGEGRNYYDLPGIGFVSYFTPKGVAIHGTYWHNDYGRRRSHGCVNVPTAASQWVYRWTRPDVPYEKSRLFANQSDATRIEVVY